MNFLLSKGWCKYKRYGSIIASRLVKNTIFLCFFAHTHFFFFSVIGHLRWLASTNDNAVLSSSATVAATLSTSSTTTDATFDFTSSSTVVPSSTTAATTISNLTNLSAAEFASLDSKTKQNQWSFFCCQDNLTFENLGYYHRLLARMQYLRMASPTHSHDITSNEVSNKSNSFALLWFWFALCDSWVERHRLSNIVWH